MFNRHRAQPVTPEMCDEIIDTDVALASRLDVGHRARLRELTLELITAKHWEPARSFDLTDRVRVTIAANASLPVLGLGLGLYRNVRTILVTPTRAVSRGQRSGPATGVFSDEPIEVIGQAGSNTMPVSVAWDAALADSRAPAAGRNVVIHEFAHKIDMADGYSDGAPPLRPADAARWSELVDAEFRNGPLPDDPLRPYAWTNPAEFFAVSVEVFFCRPEALVSARPALYNALRTFFDQDPASSH